MSNYKICFYINLTRLISRLSKVLGILFILVNSSRECIRLMYSMKYKRLNVISLLKASFHENRYC